MDFLINNIGWFFCIAIVSILALIGYKADKKEKQQNNTSNKYIPKEEPTYEETPIEPKEEKKEEDNFYYNPQEEIKSIENNEPQMSTKNEMDEEMAALYEPLPPMQDQNKPEENPNENSKDQSLENLYYVEPPKEQEMPNQINEQQEQTVQQNIQPEPQAETVQEPTQIVPDINNLENLNISLQDLENKNYNQLLNKINQQEPMPELKQDSQTEIQENRIEPEPKTGAISTEQNNNQYVQESSGNTQQIEQSNIENQTNQTIEPQNIFEQTVPTVEPTQDVEQISTQQEQNIENTNPEINEHQFDNEINNEIESTAQPEQNDVFAFNAQENKYEGAIPEIFETNQQNNDSINDTSYLEKAENSNNETNNETNLYNDSIDDDIWKF